MSGDEIVFGEMKVREPERLTRPDRDRRYACLAYEVPEPFDLPIFIDRRTADAIERHALSDTSVELGGILLGKECIDPATGQPFVWVTEALEARHYANTQASFTYTHDSWEEITRERDRLHPDRDIVGWYHTHPSFGIFLSHHDLFIHRNFFSQPLQVAYVVDPINQTRGFFQWRDGGLAQVGGYYLSADRGDRLALARLANDLEKLPNTEGGGGATLSPRLEAELINMLTRPAQAHTASPVERMQIATLSGMIGTFLGILGVALVLWLFQIQTRMQDQGDAIRELARAVEQIGDGQRIANEAILRKVETDKPPEFLAQYAAVLKERDENRQLLAAQRSMTEVLGARLDEVTRKYDADEKKLAKLKGAGDEIEKLRNQVVDLEDKVDSRQRILDAASPILNYKEGDKAVRDLISELSQARLVGYAGWAFGTLMTVGLAAMFFFYRPAPNETASTPEPGRNPPSEGDRPSHRIV